MFGTGSNAKDGVRGLVQRCRINSYAYWIAQRRSILTGQVRLPYLKLLKFAIHVKPHENLIFKKPSAMSHCLLCLSGAVCCFGAVTHT